MNYFYFFFFSSRRRHTRWNCDWSSDVCSSDLRSREIFQRGREVAGGERFGDFQDHRLGIELLIAHDPRDALREPHVGERSEERRVGKECRWWWVPYHEKEKTQ